MRHEYKRILLLGLPILIGQLGSIVTGFVDNIMVGRYTTEALASASFTNNVFNMALMACLGFTYGITPLVGALFTQRRHTDIGALMRNAAWLNVAFALVVMAIMTAVYIALPSLGQPAELLPVIRPYFIISIIGVLPIAVFNAFAQWSYGINNTGMPMWIILAANVLNVAGNYALIYGHFGLPEMGLTGAGISTLAARCVCASAIVAVFFLSRRNSAFRRGWHATRLRGRTLGKVLRTSLPVSLQMSFETAAFSGAAILCGMLGKIPLAAFQIIVITGTLGFCIYYSIGAAVAVRVSNAMGVADRAGMRRSAWAGYHILLVIMVMSSLVFVFFGRTIMHAFTDDAAVLTLATSLIFPLVLYQLGDATQINFANALRGTAHVTPMLWISFFCYMILGLPSSWLLAFPCGMGTYGIVLSFSVSLFSAAILFLYFFLRTTRHSPHPQS